MSHYHSFGFIIIWIFEVICLVGNILFLYHLTRRQTLGNSCYFVQHGVAFAFTNILTITYNLALVSNPLYADNAKEYGMQGNVVLIVWSLGVYVYLAQHFGIVILTISRIVALTFKHHMHPHVWNGHVSYFAIGVQFLFPLLFVFAFMFDDSKIEFNHKIIWGNRSLHEDYNLVRSAVHIIIYAFVFPGLLLAFAKRTIVVFYKRTVSEGSAARRRETEWVVHTVRGASVPADSQIVVPYRPNVRPLFPHKEEPVAIIVAISFVVNAIQFFILEEEFAQNQPLELIASLLASAILPILLELYWFLPTLAFKLKYDRGYLCRLYRRHTGPILQDITLRPPEYMGTTPLEPTISAIYYPRGNFSSGAN